MLSHQSLKWLFGALASSMCLLGCTAQSLQLNTFTPPVASSEWKNVAIGGGGYVTNVYIHPHDSETIYSQTDNGGFYRWNPQTKTWIPITDHFSLKQKNFYGGAALAFDPSDPDVVLIATGQYVSAGEGAVFRSEDRGQTWRNTELTVPMGSDEYKRWAGHRLVMSPRDSKIVLFGSRRHGLWRSQDGGWTWSQVKTLQAAPHEEVGLIAIAFDPQNANRVVLGAYGDGLYTSSDAGQTWQRMPNSPSHPMRVAIAQDSSVYVTSDQKPGVSRYHQGQWTEITPPAEQHRVFNGLSVHPSKPGTLLVSVGEDGSSDIFQTHNAGQSWKKLTHQVNNLVPWWPNKFFRDHTSAIQFNPSRPNQVWLSDWFGTWMTEDINAKPIQWTNQVKGHEQVVVFDLLAPSQGAPLLSGVADVTGFIHSRLDQFPQGRLTPGSQLPFLQEFDQDTYSFAYSAKKPLHIVRVGGKRWKDEYGIYRSSNGGQAWTRLSFPKALLPLRVAMSASDPNNFVVVNHKGGALVTVNAGKTWQSVQGLPSGLKGPWHWSQPIAADGVKGDRYYYYHQGIIYRSDNRGQSFQAIYQSLPAVDHYAIHTRPGCFNCLWISLGTEGLFWSQNGGQSFTKISKVKNAHLFDVGLGSQNQENWYVYGDIGQNTGVFLSQDQGKTWRDIGEKDRPIGAQPRILEASEQYPGLLFIGTNGRGIFTKTIRP